MHLTCECTFGATSRLYTYLTLTHYPPGTVVLAEVGEDKVQPVTVHGNHPSPAPLNPKITYRWLLGTPQEVRAAFGLHRKVLETAKCVMQLQANPNPDSDTE